MGPRIPSVSSSSSANKTRKERRKEERVARKSRKGPLPLPSDGETTGRPESNSVSQPSSFQSKRKEDEPKKACATRLRGSKPKPKSNTDSDHYAHLSTDVAAALRRDDAEIAALEEKLLMGGKDKKRLKREYAQLEGYGDDFVDFLDDLDSLSQRLVSSNSVNAHISNEHDDQVTETDEAYSDSDDILDIMPDQKDGDSFNGDSSDQSEELVPMKNPAFSDLDDDDSILDEIEDEATEYQSHLLDDIDFDDEKDSNRNGVDCEETHDSHHNQQDDHTKEDEEPNEPDHDVNVTYQPSKGEDIYGKAIEVSEKNTPPQKYIPPHMRTNQQECGDNITEQSRQESYRIIQRSLNSALNRLSEDTLVSVVQLVAKLYASNPTRSVNECYWNITENTCVARSQQMTGIIPVFVAAITGVHLHKGDNAQLAEFIIEKVVTVMWKRLQSARKDFESPEDTVVGSKDDANGNKDICNLGLLLCYFYNFGVIHCTLVYDIVRNLIESCSEIDVEVLLLLLSHCGRALRSDDPSALKEIVLLVRKQSLNRQTETKASSTRSDYMVSAIMDLKNNKRRKQDEALAEKTAKLRKALGHMKTSIASSTKSQRCSDASLRITLHDILEVDTKGRWWKVGASWTGNMEQTAGTKRGIDDVTGKEKAVDVDDADEELLRLAKKYRMNTDARRSIFCVIMGSIDYEDCFEKLVRAEMLKNRSERDTVRVLMECCGNESSYNKFYSHLAARICEYQPQCKFTFQLAFWDTFKQFDDLPARKVANLAKLLFHLVALHNCLKINVVKAIDMAEVEDLPETAMIFLTIFFSCIMDHFDDPEDVFRLFIGGVGRKKSTKSYDNDDVVEEDLGHMDDGEALQAHLTVFLIRVLKSSPKNKNGSKFRANLKAATKACDVDKFF